MNISAIIKKKSGSLIFFTRTISSFSLLFFSTTALSQADENCPAIPDSVIHKTPPLFSEAEQNNTNISADKTRSDNQGNSSFQGNVVIEKHELRITADKVSFNSKQENINIEGNVHVDTTTMAMDADSGQISKEKQSSIFRGVKFQVGDSNMRGAATSISADKQTRTELNKTTITSCNLNDPDWRLNANNISLYHEEEYGSADSVVLRFMEVPFLYIPYMEFPLGERRRSGLLVPEAGYSTSRGTEFVVPWYWNIATNHDAIIAPHFMSRRGTQLDTQYRFLTESSEGQVDAEFLYDDKITGESRHQFQYQQDTRFTPELKMKVDIKDVSDTEYFNDFSNNLSTSSITHLNREVKLNYTVDYWQAGLLAKTFETLDTSIDTDKRPYRQLPELTLEGDQPLGDSGLAFTLDSEWVDFDHEDDTVETGSRFRIQPGLHWRQEGAFWFVDPAVKFSHTQYDLEDGDGLNDNDTNVSISTLDAGLFFERELDNGFIHTLEPRLYYLNVPFRDQSQLPDFDSALSTFSTALLFRDNRFNGGDRIGDANQITLALSTRLIDPSSGEEYLRASVGRINYFEDRLVGTFEDEHQSDLMAELATNWNDWSLSSSTQWNTDTNRSERGNFLLHYQSDLKHIFNLGLRSDRSSTTTIRQTDLSFVMPVSNEVNAFARWNYSLVNNQDIEVIGGLSYDSCCWSIQLLGQRRLLFNDTKDEEEYDNTFLIQLVLKGMGSVSGNKLRNTLEHAILGYDED